MRSFRHFKSGAGLALVISALLAGQALGTSQISYSLELGGNNNAAAWKAGTRTLYTRGSSDPGQYFYKLDPVNYAVVLEAGGIHSQLGHPSDNLEIFGAANVVFNLELRDSQGNLVTDAIFKSTINDGQGSDPLAAAAFSCSFQIGASIGRLIDPVTLGGPRMEPIYTYPTAPPGSGTWIGMGAGFKEWVRTGTTSLYTMPGVGMVTYPNLSNPQNRRTGFGIVPVAEGQIDVSGLADGTYTLTVTPGNGNNVLRGDMDMYAATNRPAFAVAANQVSEPYSISFEVGQNQWCTPGIVASVFYNNSAWDTAGDEAAIAPDKQALLPGNTSSFANYISYNKSLNGLIVDGCQFNREPVWGQDILAVMGNTSDPFSWSDEVPAPQSMTYVPGPTPIDSDRLIITWADNAIPNTKWVLFGMFYGDGSLGIPADEFFMYGVAIGEANGTYIVDASDEIIIRNNPRPIFNPAPIDNPYDINRDKQVNATDQIISRSNKTTPFTRLVQITW